MRSANLPDMRSMKLRICSWYASSFSARLLSLSLSACCSSGVSLKESGEYLLSSSRRFSSASRRKSRMPLTDRWPSSERKSAAHQVAQRAPHAFFLEQMIGKMLDEIVRRGEKNFLRAIPFGVSMNSHLVLTIAQIRVVSNPNFARSKSISVNALAISPDPLELLREFI